MKKSTWKTYAVWIILTEAVGMLSGLLTRRGMELYKLVVQKPPLSPPAAVFPVVWIILYALMGIGGARIYMSVPSAERTRGLRLYAAQLAFNFVWSILFFGVEAYGFALLWLAVLWALILWMFLTFRKVDHPAAWMQLPYLIWVLFAGYLNAGVWILNR